MRDVDTNTEYEGAVWQREEPEEGLALYNTSVIVGHADWRRL